MCIGDDGFDAAVCGAGIDAKAAAEAIDGLSMRGADDTAALCVQPGENAAVGQVDRMFVCVVARWIAVPRLIFRGEFGNAPAEGEVEQLHAAADTQHGFARIEESRDEGEFEGVAARFQSDVRATLQEQGVAGFDVGVGENARRGVRRQCHPARQCAGLLKAGKKGVAEEKVHALPRARSGRLAAEQARRHGDAWAHGASTWLVSLRFHER